MSGTFNSNRSWNLPWTVKKFFSTISTEMVGWILRGRFLYRNDGNNQFTTIDLGFATNSSARYIWADLDGDGADDFMRYEALFIYDPVTVNWNTRGSQRHFEIILFWNKMINGFDKYVQ